MAAVSFTLAYWMGLLYLLWAGALRDSDRRGLLT